MERPDLETGKDKAVEILSDLKPSLNKRKDKTLMNKELEGGESSLASQMRGGGSSLAPQMEVGESSLAGLMRLNLKNNGFAARNEEGGVDLEKGVVMERPDLERGKGKVDDVRDTLDLRESSLARLSLLARLISLAPQMEVGESSLAPWKPLNLKNNGFAARNEGGGVAVPQSPSENAMAAIANLTDDGGVITSMTPIDGRLLVTVRIPANKRTFMDYFLSYCRLPRILEELRMPRILEEFTNEVRGRVVLRSSSESAQQEDTLVILMGATAILACDATVITTMQLPVGVVAQTVLILSTVSFVLTLALLLLPIAMPNTRMFKTKRFVLLLAGLITLLSFLFYVTDKMRRGAPSSVVAMLVTTILFLTRFIFDAPPLTLARHFKTPPLHKMFYSIIVIK